MPDDFTEELIRQREEARDLKRQLGDLDKVTGIQTNKQGVVKIIVKRYVISTRSISGDILIWGNPQFGIWGTNKWGNIAYSSFILGSPVAGLLGSSKLGSQLSDWEIYYDSGDLE
jgi:hypothetical protein